MTDEDYYESEYECYDCDCDCHHPGDEEAELEHTCGGAEEVVEVDESSGAGMSYAEAWKVYTDERDGAARGLSEIGGMLRAGGWPIGDENTNDGGPRKPLIDDPERLVGPPV